MQFREWYEKVIREMCKSLGLSFKSLVVDAKEIAEMKRAMLKWQAMQALTTFKPLPHGHAYCICNGRLMVQNWRMN